MAEITLRFVTCSDLVSRIIRSAELGCTFSHTECVMPDGTLLGAHYQGGVQARPADYDRGEWTQEIRVSVPVTDEQEAAFYTFLKAQVSKAYDMVAIGELALGELEGGSPNWPQKNTWICSALITGALLTAGIIKSAPTTVRLATPRDVLCMIAGLAEIPDAQTPVVAA